MNNTITPAQVGFRARYFYGGCLLLFTISLVSNTLFSQMSQPVLIFPSVDIAYWLFHGLGIPSLATHSYLVSAILDMLLFFLPIIAIIVVHRRIYAIAYTLLILVYQITYSTYATHHYHALVGVLFLSVPFWFEEGHRFVLLWNAARYYFFFIFSSAAIWKLLRGGLFEGHQMQRILMEQHVQYIYDYPRAIASQLAMYLIGHPALAQCLLIAGFILQFSFIGGFFTRKFDRIYLLLFLIFFAFNYVVMHIFSLELFIFCLVLLDWDKIERGYMTVANVPGSGSTY